MVLCNDCNRQTVLFLHPKLPKHCVLCSQQCIVSWTELKKTDYGIHKLTTLLAGKSWNHTLIEKFVKFRLHFSWYIWLLFGRKTNKCKETKVKFLGNGTESRKITFSIPSAISFTVKLKVKNYRRSHQK